MTANVLEDFFDTPVRIDQRRGVQAAGFREPLLMIPEQRGKGFDA